MSDLLYCLRPGVWLHTALSQDRLIGLPVSVTGGENLRATSRRMKSASIAFLLRGSVHETAAWTRSMTAPPGAFREAEAHIVHSK